MFHNAPYDIGWLRTLGIEVKGKIVDTMIVAPDRMKTSSTTKWFGQRVSK